MSSPAKGDSGKARTIANNGSHTQALNSPNSSFSGKNGIAGFKGIQVLKSGVIDNVLVSGRDEVLRAADSETGITSPKGINPINALYSPHSHNDA